MPRPDRRLWLVLGGLLPLAGCGGGASFGAAKESLSVAPVYTARDSEAVRRQHNYQTQLALAGADLQAGQLASAEKRARAAQRLDDSRPDALMVLAAVADRQGRASEAGALLRRSAELAPQRGDVLNNYGAWLCQSGEAVEALGWFERALAAPGYTSPATALANAGRCALQAGQLDRAVSDLRQAVQRDPGNPLALESLARIAFDQGRFLEARAFSERRLVAAPVTVSVLQLASQIETRLGDSLAADRYLQRIRQEFPQDAGSNSQG